MLNQLFCSLRFLSCCWTVEWGMLVFCRRCWCGFPRNFRYALVVWGCSCFLIRLILLSTLRTRLRYNTRQPWRLKNFVVYPNKEFFLQDLNKTEETNAFSEKSKKLITDMGNTEILELCVTSPKKQRPDCALYLEIGVVCWSCGRSLITIARDQTVRQEELMMRYQLEVTSSKKDPLSWCQTWSFRTATNALQSQEDAGRSPKQWWLQNHFGKMAQGWQIPQIFVRLWLDWGADYSVWRTCIGRPLIHCNSRGKNSKRENWVLKLNKEGELKSCRAHRVLFL